MAWTNLSFAFGAILTSTQMTQLDDNLDALMSKAAGAPVLANSYIVTAMIGALQVTEAKLAAAVSAQLVTNGDTHNHSGGDGADIPNASVTGLGALALLSSVGPTEIDSSAVHQAEINLGTATDSTTSASAVAVTLSSSAYELLPLEQCIKLVLLMVGSFIYHPMVLTPPQ